MTLHRKHAAGVPGAYAALLLVYLVLISVLPVTARAAGPYPGTSPGKQAERYLFKMLDTSSGLPDNNVRNMTMLPDGLMCIQTSTMLSLYNGASCKSYKYNPMEIPYTEYSGLNNSYFDEAGNLLWCTSRDHIWIFNLNTRSFEYNIGDRFAEFGLEDETITNFFIDSEDNYWIATSDSGLFRCDRRTGEAEPVELPSSVRGPVLLKQSGNQLWIFSINGILTEYDLSMKTVRNVIEVKDGGSAGQETSRIDMVIGSEGDVWVMDGREAHIYVGYSQGQP